MKLPGICNMISQETPLFNFRKNKKIVYSQCTWAAPTRKMYGTPFSKELITSPTREKNLL